MVGDLDHCTERKGCTGAGEANTWSVALADFSALDPGGRLHLLMRQSTLESLAADVESRFLPALHRIPEDERSELLQRCVLPFYD